MSSIITDLQQAYHSIHMFNKQIFFELDKLVESQSNKSEVLFWVNTKYPPLTVEGVVLHDVEFRGFFDKSKLLVLNPRRQTPHYLVLTYKRITSADLNARTTFTFTPGSITTNTQGA